MPNSYNMAKRIVESVFMDIVNIVLYIIHYAAIDAPPP